MKKQSWKEQDIWRKNENVKKAMEEITALAIDTLNDKELALDKCDDINEFIGLVLEFWNEAREKGE